MSKKTFLRKLLGRNGGKNNPLGFGFSAIIIILVLLFGPDVLNFDYANDTVNNEEVEIIANEFNGNNFDVLPKQKKIPVNYVSANDGDTIRIDLNGYEVPVRYLIINSPEMNYDTNNPEPYAEEAKELNEELLTTAEQVYIELDVGPATDNYNRILAYVYSDDIMINEMLVEEGLATVRYVNPPNDSYENLLREAEDRARND